MATLFELIDELWRWAGKWDQRDCSNALDFDPLTFPKFYELRSLCFGLVNKPLDLAETRAFLICMAFDNEEEQILDCCRVHATPDFLARLIAEGVAFPKYEARWQMAELLRRDIPGKEDYLKILLNDSHPYVRKRAANIILQQPS